jgi:hypothetical protein
MTIGESAETPINGRRYRAIREHLVSDLDTKAVILSLKNGKYYGLNKVGLSIWALIQKPLTVAEIEEALLQEYEVDEETCRREVIEFLEIMIGEELIEVNEE